MRWITLLLIGLFQMEFSHAASEEDEAYFRALQQLDFEELKQDIIDTLFDSKDFYPADYGFYGPFMVRYAWHCSGTLRMSDGEGGCEGGRIRFEPERSWSDNTNLDKAFRILAPLKLKYGLGLSWGDLIVYTGTVALEFMGVPTIGFCAGRVDDVDGSDSVIFGPGELQEEVTPCEDNGDCSTPFGAKLLEHIYVDPLGFKGDPDPAKSVEPIRDVFTRMGMNDEETVALIGGGHTFGKVHGACAASVGPSPKEDPENPWPFPNQCGSNPSNKTTSGFEGPWNGRPLEFNNFFFTILLTRDLELRVENGVHLFRINEENAPKGPSADDSFEDAINGVNRVEDVAMLVTDVALTEDESYRAIAARFGSDLDNFGEVFAEAWYKLTTRDMGPVSRCFGNQVPEAKSFQGPLPAPFTEFPSLNDVRRLGEDILNTAEERALLIEAAYLCASTFRVTDHFGGCNGARIFKQPERSWEDRLPLEQTLATIESLVDESSLDISKADFLVSTATQALKDALPARFQERVNFFFCPLRSDAVEDVQEVSGILQLQTYDNKLIQLRRQLRLLDLSAVEFVALQGRPRSETYMTSLGYSGSYVGSNETLTNIHAKLLLTNTWTRTGETGIFGDEFTNEEGDSFITFFDFALTLDDQFSSALVELAQDERFFLDTFERAWTKLMNVDRYDGPVGNLCLNGNIELVEITATETEEDESTTSLVVGSTLIALIVVISAIFLYVNRGESPSKSKPAKSKAKVESSRQELEVQPTL